MNSKNKNQLLDGFQIFLVEDEVDNRELLTLILESAGANVIATGTVRQALDTLEQCKPDILISDLRLPDGDGCSIVKEVRTREQSREKAMPAIAISGFDGNAVGITTREAGFQQHICKPFEIKALIQLVANLVENSN